MCGRVLSSLNPRRLMQLAAAGRMRNGDRYGSSFNMCPTNYLPTIRHTSNVNAADSKKCNGEDQKEEVRYGDPSLAEEVINEEGKPNRVLDFVKWGHQGGPFFVINARVEEMTEKPMFKGVINRSRCVVIVEGYYEWNPKKEPYCHKHKEKEYLLMAGVTFRDETVILLTRESKDDLGAIHHRMPVLLNEDLVDMWLDCEHYDFRTLLDKYVLDKSNDVWEHLNYYRIGPAVNDIKNKTEECIHSLEQHKQKLDKTGIMRFMKKPGGTAAPKDGKKEVPSDVQVAIQQDLNKEAKKEEAKPSTNTFKTSEAVNSNPTNTKSNLSSTNTRAKKIKFSDRTPLIESADDNPTQRLKRGKMNEEGQESPQAKLLS
eukprot:TRINITY_DN3322_c0_g1_i1.p1 TRINITY_DN3322_c0_g1~~TRINITY_DN3322_c0_g1_i1.p1  ORF type:complete len:372 (+),score=79.38 TRINITY_DN3322_c0_g1_i1:110-1225(+)